MRLRNVQELDSRVLLTITRDEIVPGRGKRLPPAGLVVGDVVLIRPSLLPAAALSGDSSVVKASNALRGVVTRSSPYSLGVTLDGRTPSAADDVAGDGTAKALQLLNVAQARRL